jgi:UDP-N-acetylmuramoyl-L-alanyl-D-glutamate--2,6-diaminopimelate ligase
MQLDHLLTALPSAQIKAQIQGRRDINIAKIECDSRAVGPGDLFVAIRGGEEVDRHRFIGAALQNGASALVVEEEVAKDGGATVVFVDNARRALAALAAQFYDHPAAALQVVGITGTNGKTTTAYLLHSVMQAGGLAAGYIGTLGLMVGKEKSKGDNTTPEAHILHRDLAAMASGGCQGAVLEVSSHALALSRVEGIEFAAAVFTNLSRDHLDFHRDEAGYLAAKAILFDQAAAGRGVFNLDDKAGLGLWEKHGRKGVGYGFSEAADVVPLRWEAGRKGVLMDLRIPGGKLEIRSRLTGRFNCHNVMAAVACGMALGLPPEAIKDGVEAVANVPGRFERLTPDSAFEVIVDYAHTPDALDNALRAARPLVSGRLICVFGCGGDRDRGKRAQMGAVARRRADWVILTSDNPRSEDPEAILDDIAAGMGQGPYERQPERGAAIAMAVEVAQAGDVVVLAGKGHETEQIFADQTLRFDDRVVARKALERLGHVPVPPEKGD